MGHVLGNGVRSGIVGDIIAAGERIETLLSVRSARGHDMGWIGVTLSAHQPRPPAHQIRNRIEALVTRLADSKE